MPKGKKIASSEEIKQVPESNSDRTQMLELSTGDLQ